MYEVVCMSGVIMVIIQLVCAYRTMYIIIFKPIEFLQSHKPTSRIRHPHARTQYVPLRAYGGLEHEWHMQAVYWLP